MTIKAKFITITTLFLAQLFSICCLANDKEIYRTLQPVFNNLRTKHNSLKIGSQKFYKIENYSIDKRKKSVQLSISKNFEAVAYREEIISELYDSLKANIPQKYKNYNIEIFINSLPIQDYVPNLYRKNLKRDKERLPKHSISKNIIVQNESKPFSITKGLANRHIALWNSHGWFYDNKDSLNGYWRWQRPRLFQITEDTYTSSVVLPYLMPMLENAGAYVFCPRERDIQKHEFIADNNDNDTRTYFEFSEQKNEWEESEDSAGFANTKEFYTDFENPFKLGSYRKIKSRKHGEAYVEWTPIIPEEGDYAVYVSYHTLPESVTDAHYTVFHTGGETQFTVNQKMGGGTWIYLGTFHFKQGAYDNAKVRLTNNSKSGGIITADAVKFGGGMGNIGKKWANGKDTIIKASGRQRFLEGAKYWLQWAGYPDSVYSRSKGKNDYNDDFMCRGYWVNNLLGGSDRNPLDTGKNVPIDVALALHTDAGTTTDSTTIGTMAIYMTGSNNGLYATGSKRMAARDLSDIIQTQVVEDIRTQFCSKWNRRAIYDKSYHEARVPEVPTVLLEFLAHQNYDDMKYALDPNFKFCVSRAIYKGIVKFLAYQYDFEYVIQPLPPTNLSTQLIDTTETPNIFISWQAQEDTVEATAQAKKYILYTAIGNNGFDNGTLVDGTSIFVPIEHDLTYRFKVTAVNEGGESFPSEILSSCCLEKSKGKALIVNAFNRVSCPEHFRTEKHSGFIDRLDNGVPDKYDICYTGSQYNFTIGSSFKTDNTPGHGASKNDYETSVIAGNSFNFPYVHGEAIKKAGYSFVSCSDEEFEKGQLNLSDYFFIDMIYGEEKETKSGFNYKYEVLSEKTIGILKDYLTEKEGNLLITGAYLGSEIFEKDSCSEIKQDFAENVLNISFMEGYASKTGTLASQNRSNFSSSYRFNTSLNDKIYAVEAPNALNSINEGQVQMRYADTKLPALVTYKGKHYSTVTAGFPFEALISESQRNRFMSETISFFEGTGKIFKNRTKKDRAKKKADSGKRNNSRKKVYNKRGQNKVK